MVKTAAQKTTQILKAGISMSKKSIKISKFSLARDNRKGAFTFVEVIAALTIVSIALVALLKLNIISINTTDVAGVICEATFLAEEKIAEVITDGYPRLGTESGTVERNALPLYWNRQVTDIRPTELAEANITGMRQISVDVSWMKGTSRRNIQMSTYIADRKLP